SLPTLPFRVREAEKRAQALAERLAADPRDTRVLFPGLPGGDPKNLLGRQLRGPGSVIAFEVKGGFEAAARLLASLRLITPAVSLGSTDTLIQHPASLTHRLVDPAARAEAGITDGLLRLSVGLEDADDLWSDLARGLAAASSSIAA
ncbi:MAG: PLP-dependent transferase, partial [Gaiellaceae bacterium]